MRAAVLGLGAVGRQYARLLQASARVALAGAVEINGVDGGVDRDCIYSSLDGLLAAERIDFGVVALPTALHGDAAAALANEGIHMLVEKPLALDARGAASIVSACARAGVHGAVGHVERFNPAAVALKARLREGAVGRPIAVVSERRGPRPTRIRDMGVISDLATHDLDLIPWLLDGAIESLSAQASRPADSEHDHFAVITGRLSGGTVFNAVVDWLSRARRRRVRVVGEDGSLVADTLAPSLLHVSPGKATPLSIDVVEPLAAQLEAFCDVIAGRDDSQVVSLQDGLRAVACADAAFRSAREQRVITV